MAQANPGGEGSFAPPPLIVRFEVPGRPPDLHHGSDLMRWSRAKKVKARRQLVGTLAAGARNLARLPTQCPLERRSVQPIVHWRGPERDEINLLQDLKADIDAIVDAGLLVDDKRLWCQVERPRYVRAPTLREIKVVYEIRPMLELDGSLPARPGANSPGSPRTHAGVW
jgi:hypothetical protein